MKILRHSILITTLLLTTVNLFSQEICNNRIDDDGDGLIDCNDGDCNEDNSCWDCVDEFYQVHSNSTVVALNPGTGNYTTVGTISNATDINGAQMNPFDGHVYAPCKINGNHTLGMLNRDGSVTDLGLDLPGASVYYVGGIGVDGKFYIGRGSNKISYIDLLQEELTVVETNASANGIADFSVDNTNGLLYGITSGAELKVFDPYTESMSTYDLAGSINNDTGSYGAAWSSVDGSFFAYNNSSGKIYSINVNELTATQVLNGVGNLSINDGFNCFWADAPFETKCNDGIDNDGDGLVDCEDGDCFNSNQCTVEICDNGIDDDGDGWIDCSDTECFSLNMCYEDCTNGIDDNNNGLIDGEDTQCNAPSGVSGGLESNGTLADKISERHIKNTFENKEEIELIKSGVIAFSKNKSSRNFEIKNFIPQNILDAFVAESTPNDLIGITNAEEVAAADYYQNDQRIGSILAIKSQNIYEHTKYICDRLDGSRLLDISHTYSQSGMFMTYELLNANLNAEYAISFSMYHDDKGFTIENHWNLHSYPSDKEYYNFQIWARSYQELIELLEGTLDEIINRDRISDIIHSELPKLFVTYGTYNNGVLKMQLRNKNLTENMSFEAYVRRTETSDYEQVKMEIPLTGMPSEIVEVPIGYLYDMGGALHSTNSISDELFLADGRWSVDLEHPGASVGSYSINEQATNADDNVLQIERGITLNATVNDYLNIYRSIDAKYAPNNLNGYNTISFYGKGEGQLEITLVKGSIVDWANQPRTRTFLNPDGQNISLNISSFNLEETKPWDDISMIVFTLIADNGKETVFDISLSDLRFENLNSTSTIEQQIGSNHCTIYPNPVSTEATFTLPKDANANNMTIRISDNLGKVIINRRLSLGAKQTEFKIDLSGLEKGFYHYGIYNGKELSFSGSLIKM